MKIVAITSIMEMRVPGIPDDVNWEYRRLVELYRLYALKEEINTNMLPIRLAVNVEIMLELGKAHKKLETGE